MDDGGITNSGIRIATNSFKLKEVELLNDVLKSKYNLETTIQKIWIKDQYSIYIKKQSRPNLRNIVIPFIHSSMLYKLGDLPPPQLSFSIRVAWERSPCPSYIKGLISGPAQLSYDYCIHKERVER